MISFTNPCDACRLACVSTIFRFVADSDIILDNFLRPEYLSMISDPGSISSLSKKELYLRTCPNPIHKGKLDYDAVFDAIKTITPFSLKLLKDLSVAALFPSTSSQTRPLRASLLDGKYAERDGAEPPFTSRRPSDTLKPRDLQLQILIVSFSMCPILCEIRTFNMAPCNQRLSTVSAVDTRITSSDSGFVAPVVSEDCKEKESVRPATYANVKLHVDFTRHAPLNVGKWGDIPEEQIQALIDRVLSKFDVDISSPYAKGWMLWKMKLEYKNARRRAQDGKIMELMSKFASSSIGSLDMDKSS
ncbi:hypothetical protein EZV62_000451 [Acer yangbiense]|uniref:F-box domain-containing protein n=1 Tax=Acer yangbiense TaxID=1000413 RepID=A0A5C7ITX5_9ROSI|nr:hypothetical protein EZV62_000451 [Acer yangbiense]